MLVWLYIIIPSIIIGAVVAIMSKGRLSFILSAFLPWVGVLCFLLYYEYFVPYQGGGASMWPIALLFAGTIAAIIGVFSCIITKLLYKVIPENVST